MTKLVSACSETDEDMMALGVKMPGAKGGLAAEDVLRGLEDSGFEFLETWEEDRFKLLPAAMLWPYNVTEFPELDRAFDAIWAVVEKTLLEKIKRRRKWRKTKYFCKQVVANLYLALLRGQSVWVHKNRNRYSGGKLFHWHYGVVVKVICAMEETEIIYESWHPSWSSDGKGCWCTEYKLGYLGRKLLSDNIRRHPCKVHRPLIGGPVQVQVRRQPETRGAAGKAGTDLAKELTALNNHLEKFSAAWCVPLGYLARLDDRRLKGILTSISGLIPAILNHIQDTATVTSEVLTSDEPDSNGSGALVSPSSSPSIPILLSTSKSRKGVSLEDYSLLGLVRWLQSQKGSREVVEVPLDIRLYRVFSVDREADRDNASAWRNGRYVAEYQCIPEELRRLISVNGRFVAERDFSALFSHLAYHGKGLIPPEGYRSIAGLAKLLDSERGKLEKLASLIVFGSGARKTSVKAVQGELNLAGVAKVATGAQVVEEMEQANPLIVDRFHRDYGVTLMRVESEIATEVMERFMKMDLPILCVHDSFLSWDPELLSAEMDRAYFLRTGYHCPIH